MPSDDVVMPIATRATNAIVTTTYQARVASDLNQSVNWRGPESLTRFDLLRSGVDIFSSQRGDDDLDGPLSMLPVNWMGSVS